jgi:mannosylglycerate hydrolase MGH1-like protein
VTAGISDALRRAALVAIVVVGAASQPARAQVPPAVDPGTPEYSGPPAPAEPVPVDPARSALEAIYAADLAAGGSFWFDRMLERPFRSGQDSHLYTRGRALYMYNHNPAQLGFAGGYAYRERPTGSNQSLYTVSVSDAALVEDTAQRRQNPSHWSSVHTADGLRVAQTKFITRNNVAVTVLTVTNTGSAPTTRTITAGSPIAGGPVSARYGLTTFTPRLSGDVDRTFTLEPGRSITLKVEMGLTTRELPESTAEYERYREYDPETAVRTHVREYNRWWVENVPYIDVPDENVKKMSYYRMFLNRFNHFDGNIPGNDYQFPVSIEGVLGYNNAIQLTQPMHMQDLKYFRDPLYSYGNWVSSGESSKCTAFTDNPGDTLHWNNNHEQYIAREAWNAYKVHGGEPDILDNLAHYAECDVEGQLRRFDTNGNHLVEYASGFYTGNDADAVALHYYNPPPPVPRNAVGRAQDRTDTALWYSGARAAAEAYALRGHYFKAAKLAVLAARIRASILRLLWDDEAQVFKQKDLETGNLVPWKEQQNFLPFTEGIVPSGREYRPALRFFADRAEFPIMPFSTANQRDKAEAVAAGRPGSNNFSNINSTLQAQLYSKAIRSYPSEHITPGMYRRLLDWLTWTQYVGGDNRYPDNNEYFFDWDPKTRTLGRSGIHHNILGAYNFMIFEDVAGIRPRLDDVVELWPIDVGYDHFTVNNLRYHGRDLSIVWDEPGDGERHYGRAPEGYSLYVGGRRVVTVDDLARVTWDARTGAVHTGAKVLFRARGSLERATRVRLAGNARVADMFQKAAVDLSGETNLAAGKPVSASFTAPDTAAAHAVDGFSISGPAVAPGFYGPNPAYGAANPTWGSKGSPNAQESFAVDLRARRSVDTVRLYFYSNKEFGSGPPQGPQTEGGTYREPASYTVQYHDGDRWVDARDQVWTPATPWPNYNAVEFRRVKAQRVRVLMTPTPGYAIGLKEIQVLETDRGAEE